MNRLQKFVVVVTLLVMAGMLMFPPFSVKAYRNMSYTLAKHRFILRGIPLTEFSDMKDVLGASDVSCTQINGPILLCQEFFVFLLGSALFVIVSPRKKQLSI